MQRNETPVDPAVREAAQAMAARSWANWKDPQDRAARTAPARAALAKRQEQNRARRNR